MPATLTSNRLPISQTRAEKRLAELERGGFYVSDTGITVYTDASVLCHVPGRPAGVGLVWGKGTWADNMLQGEQTPSWVVCIHQAEFYAVIRALEEHPNPRVDIEVRTDSKVAINYFTNYKEWRDVNWHKRPRGQHVRARDLIKLNLNLINLLQRLGRALSALKCQVTVVWVRGHSGDWRNDLADTRAHAAARGHLVVAKTVCKSAKDPAHLVVRKSVPRNSEANGQLLVETIVPQSSEAEANSEPLGRGDGTTAHVGGREPMVEELAKAGGHSLDEGNSSEASEGADSEVTEWDTDVFDCDDNDSDSDDSDKTSLIVEELVAGHLEETDSEDAHSKSDSEALGWDGYHGDHTDKSSETWENNSDYSVSDDETADAHRSKRQRVG